MIKLGSFLNPHTTRQRILKWMIIISIVLTAVALFLLNLDDIVTYEAACNNPVYVQATITVKKSTSLFSSAESLDVVLDYSYDGVYYPNVHYQSSRSPRWWTDNGKTITVAVNPKNPGQLVQDMLNHTAVWLSLLLCALGLSALIYTLALEFPRFRTWRIRTANKPAFLSRPHGKSKPEVFEPDYIKDIFFLMLLICIPTIVILSLIFPYTFSMTAN